MSLFESSITGNILNDGSTTAESGITAGQLATVLTAYTPITDTATNTSSIAANATAAANNAAADRSQPEQHHRPEHQPTTAAKANQSALDALALDVAGKSTPASVDTKLQAYSTTAAMNSAITSANNTTLAFVASTYALQSVVNQLAVDLAPLEVDTKIANAALAFVQQTALDAALALRDGEIAAAEAAIAALQAAGYQTAAQVTSAIVTALLPYLTQANLDAALAVRDARPGHRHSGAAVRGALRHHGGPDGDQDLPPIRDRRHSGAAGGPDRRRRQQPDQRAGLARQHHLGPAAGHQQSEEPALQRPLECQPAERRLHPEP